MTRLRPSRDPPTLARRKTRMETRLAYPYAHPRTGVAVPLIVDDAFPDYVREHRLPACSVSFLTQAGAWSARTSKSGFVPASMIAEFTDDPDQAIPAALAAGFLKRGKSGGVRIAEGRGLTVVNAKEVTEKVTRDIEEKRCKREEWNARKRRQRDAERAERTERMAAGVTQKSRGKGADVTREQMKIVKKPQLSGGHVTRDIGVTSRVTPQIDRSNQSSSGVSQINARACADPAVIAAVIKTVAGRIERIITADDALAAIGRAIARPKTPKRIHDPVKYLTAVFENEKDLFAELLCAPAEALEAALAEPDPDRPDAERHRYERDPRTCVCKCEKPEANWRHEQPEEEARPA